MVGQKAEISRDKNTTRAPPSVSTLFYYEQKLKTLQTMTKTTDTAVVTVPEHFWIIYKLNIASILQQQLYICVFSCNSYFAPEAFIYLNQLLYDAEKNLSISRHLKVPMCMNFLSKVYKLKSSHNTYYLYNCMSTLLFLINRFSIL